MSPRTQACLQELVKWAREGNTIYPMFFSHQFGSATVSAAIRAAHKAGLIENAGPDGIGKPTWRATLPAATHSAPAAIQ